MKYKLLSWINDIWYSHVRIPASLALYLLSKILYIFKSYNLSRKLCAMSLRYGVRPAAVSQFKKILEVNPYSISDVSNGVSVGEASLRSIIIKWPEYNETYIRKGVIVITFTRTFSYYIRSVNFDELQKHFFIVLEPSWSGYADPDIFFFYKKYTNIGISCSEIEDRILLNCFRESFIPVSFGASDWVDHRKFHPMNLEKVYDSIYIANTNPIKRVKRYLDAIKNIVDSGFVEYKALLVCASWGGGEALVRKLVGEYSLEANIELKFSLGMKDLIENLCKSKVNVLLSFKEGSNRSLFEAMFCDVPVICLSENVGVNKTYINESTGILIPNLFLEQALLWMSQHSEQLKPREWAMQNISPVASTEKLMSIFNLNENIASGETVFIKTNNPEVSYFDYPNIQHREYTKRILEIFDATSVHSPETYSQLVNEVKKSFDSELTA